MKLDFVPKCTLLFNGFYSKMAGLLEIKKLRFDATVNNYFVEPSVTISYNIEQRLVCTEQARKLGDAIAISMLKLSLTHPLSHSLPRDSIASKKPYNFAAK